MEISGQLHFSRELKVSEAEEVKKILNGSMEMKDGQTIEGHDKAAGDITQIVSHVVKTLNRLGVNVVGILDILDEDTEFKLISLGKIVRKMNVRTREFSSV